jgi:signal transduction histidine kinase
MDHDSHLANRPPDATSADEPDRTWRRRWLEGAGIVVFWGAVALLTLMQHAFDPRFGDQGRLHQGEVVQTFLEYGLWAVLTPFIFWMIRRSTLERGGWRLMAPLYLLVGVAVAVFVDLLDHMLWNALVPAGPVRPVSLGYILSGFHFLGEFSLFAVLLVAGFARAYFFRFQEKQREAVRFQMESAQLQAHLAEARLQALRMQINPHFLFNALHSIADSFEDDARTARRMLARLSEILRYALESIDAQEVTLGQELRFLDGYLDIQRFRFEDKLCVFQDIQPDVREALVPNLVLQPLVENAIKHGLSQLDEPGRIELRAWREGEMLHLTVCDNGPGLAASDGVASKTAPGGVGLQNTRERLNALYGSNHRFVLAPAPKGGLMVHLSLPFHTDGDYKMVAVDEGEAER